MKRLRVLLPCLIVALLCWYPSQHADCSEQSFSNPNHAAGEQHPSRQEQEPDSKQDQVLEEWAMPASYDLGLETERAALEKLEKQIIQQQQTVNLHEDEVKETKPDQVSDTEPIAPEPEHYPEPHDKINVQTCDQDHIQDVPVSSAPESVPAQEHLSTDELALAEPFINSPDLHPGFKAQPATPPNEVEDTPPTSQSVEPPQLRVDEAVVEEPQSDQNHSYAPEVEFQSTPDNVDQEQQQQQDRQEFEKELFDLDQEDKPSRQHKPAGDVTDPSVPSKEDIPTFDEWKKQVMEVEMEKSQSLHTSTTGSPHLAKKVQKNFKNNYASVECGAKILAANSEAKSTSAILKENMDLYMLNPCSNKIWFVIELCEPIQVKQLDIANFELFSSTPKDFLVSISDRYPTSKWVKLGTFHARDERIVQSFPLDEQLFAKYLKMFIKYIKIELLSHFGSEHFCPLSLIRVFGTSMVEEYEEIADSQYLSERMEYLDEDYDYPPGYQLAEDNPNGSKNLLGSATNAILNMVNNIAANVLGATPELEGGTESEGNTTAEGNKTESTDAFPDSALLESAELEHPASQENASDSSGLSSAIKDSRDDGQIVTLVEEEEEEEPRQSTVTLMEEEGDEEEEDKTEEETRDTDRNQFDSHIYCPLFSSLSLSCMASLPELLHRWCSARLAKVRLRSLRRRQLSIQTHTHSAPSTPSPMHTPPLIPAPAPTPVKEELPLTEIVLEPEVPFMPQNDVKTVEVHIVQPNTPDTHTPELNILLEPSRTVIPTHGFSDTQSSPVWLASTHEVKVLPPVKDVVQATVSTPPLQAASIPETQQASIATPTLTVSISSQSLGSEMASSSDVIPPALEQPPPVIVPPLSELPTVLPLTDILIDKSAADSGDSQRLNVQASQLSKEQWDSLMQSGEPQRMEDVADEDLLSSSGNGNVQRTATDFYAELQNSGESNTGAANGNGMLLNGGAVHGSSQKESVFMRLNNRIKALEMNMSLSSRYLEELSQRYRKQMEEMQRAFNKTIIKLQNTSRIAQEQDQKQTDSIQVLQSQLVNVTKLMLNLTMTVSQLQKEVSDRQSYLVVSLVLCLFLGLLLCLQCCCRSSPSTSTDTAPIPRSNHYPSPKRCFSSYDDMNLMRRMTCPIIHSNSLPLCSSEVGPDDLYIVEPLKFSPEKKKKRKSKSLDKVDLLKEYHLPAPLTNGGPKCNGFHPCLSLQPLPPPPPPLPLPPPLPSLPPSVEEVSSLSTCPSKESPPEPSSSSVNSEESHMSHPAPQTAAYVSAGQCNGHGLTLSMQQLATMSRQEKRSLKRRKSRQAELGFSAVPSLQQLIKGNKEIGVGTIGVTAVTGHF